MNWNIEDDSDKYLPFLIHCFKQDKSVLLKNFFFSRKMCFLNDICYCSSMWTEHVCPRRTGCTCLEPPVGLFFLSFAGFDC